MNIEYIYIGAGAFVLLTMIVFGVIFVRVFMKMLKQSEEQIKVLTNAEASRTHVLESISLLSKDSKKPVVVKKGDKEVERVEKVTQGQEPFVNIRPVLKVSSMSLDDPSRFDCKKLGKVGEYRIFIILDKGLSEQYLFLQADNGSLLGLGNLENS